MKPYSTRVSQGTGTLDAAHAHPPSQSTWGGPNGAYVAKLIGSASTRLGADKATSKLGLSVFKKDDAFQLAVLP